MQHVQNIEVSPEGNREINDLCYKSFKNVIIVRCSLYYMRLFFLHNILIFI